MNRFVLVLFSILSCLSLCAQQTASDMNLQGNVKRLYTYKHLADSIEIKNKTDVSFRKLTLLEHIEYIFEKNGFLLAENIFDKEKDLLEQSYIYTFDENENLIEITRAQKGRFLMGRTEYKYDKQGKRTQGLVYDNQDSLRNTINYKYDSLGNLISEQTFNMINIKIQDLLHQYDENGNCFFTMSLPTRAYKSKAYRKSQKFDQRNNLIYQSYTETDSLRWEYFAKYNAGDKLIYEEVKDGNGVTTTRNELKYDKNNNRISIKQYNKNMEITDLETYYEYARGQLQSEKVYTHKKKELLKIKRYFYDDIGNWTFCIEEDKKTGNTIVHSRRISYF